MDILLMAVGVKVGPMSSTPCKIELKELMEEQPNFFLQKNPFLFLHLAHKSLADVY